MIAIAIRFPAGRFHATPWGRHVNDAAPEWPPSPWRILRAFIATWKRKHPSCNQATVERLLRKLTDLPQFSLPPASIGHIRHYMPWFKKGPADRTLIFDGFVGIDKSEHVTCLWPDVIFDADELLTLNTLVTSLGFLGRTESWTEAWVLKDNDAAIALKHVNCMPAKDDTHNSDFETVRTLCADPRTAFDSENTPNIFLTTGKDKQQIKKPVYDPDWHLCLETSELHEKHWSDPPGARWATYLRRKDCFAVASFRQISIKKRQQPTVAHFAIDSTVLPLLQDTIIIAETARRTAMGIYRRIGEQRQYGGPPPQGIPLPRSEVFSGKNAAGEPLANHTHAIYLPSDEDNDGYIDHLTIIAEMGFGPQEVKALDRMRRIKRDVGEDLNLVLLAIGQKEVLNIKSILGPAKQWISATPFIPTRHPKLRGQKKDPPNLIGRDNQKLFVLHVLIEEISRYRKLHPEVPEPIIVEPLNEEHRIGSRKLRPIQFKRFRQKRGDDGGRRPAGAFRIVFPEFVSGPICLGHSCHFGMGLFVPEYK